MTIVSNSDIETAQKCERMFYYSRVARLAPRQLSIWLRRGLFGHDCMEVGFQTIIDGGTVEDAIQAVGLGPLKDMLESGDPEVGEITKVYRHVCAFLSFSQQEGVAWRPVALEDVSMWNLSKQVEGNKELHADDLLFAYTPDIVIEFTHGIYKGQHAVLDYKFLGQYMSDVAINMAQQIPKYILYRNKHHTDFKIRRGAFVQLNTRATADAKGHKLFLIKWIEPNKHRLERIEYENEQWVERVAALSLKQPHEFLRTVNKDVCDRCFFTELCAAEFDGRPDSTIKKIMDREFVRNTYGY